MGGGSIDKTFLYSSGLKRNYYLLPSNSETSMPTFVVVDYKSETRRIGPFAKQVGIASTCIQVLRHQDITGRESRFRHLPRLTKATCAPCEGLEDWIGSWKR